MWLSTLSLLFILVCCTWSTVTKAVRNQSESLIYLNKYGYNSCSNSLKKVDCSVDHSSMLRDFQKRHGLKMNGILDAPTKYQMNRPRCGNSDFQSLSSHHHKWSRSSLTWSLRGYPRRISEAQATVLIQEAFNVWLAHIPLQIKQTCSTCSADILIDCGSGNHSCDGSSFDGPGGILAHAFHPENGRIHFDADEQWADAYDGSGVNIFLVAVHEIGHALGLGHNFDPKSIMYPAYNLFSPGSMLPNLDRQSIQEVYGTLGKS